MFSRSFIDDDILTLVKLWFPAVEKPVTEIGKAMLLIPELNLQNTIYQRIWNYKADLSYQF